MNLATMPKTQKKYLFIYTVVLRVIQDVLGNTGEPVKRSELFDAYKSPETRSEASLVNQWLKDKGVTIPLYTDFVTSTATVSDAINTLRILGFIESREEYVPTKLGREFLKSQGEWRDWIVEAPLKETEDESTIKEIDLENAKYANIWN